MRRQPPPDEPIDYSPAPEGWEEEWVESSGAALVEPGDSTKCRRPGCEWPAAWKLLRSNGWWSYCDRHTYGRRIEDGRVLYRRLRRADGEGVQSTT